DQHAIKLLVVQVRYDPLRPMTFEVEVPHPFLHERSSQCYVSRPKALRAMGLEMAIAALSTSFSLPRLRAVSPFQLSCSRHHGLQPWLPETPKFSLLAIVLGPEGRKDIRQRPIQ